MIDLTVLAVIGVSALIVSAGSLLCVLQLSRQQRQLARSIKVIHCEMNALSTGSIGVGKKIVEIEGRFRGLVARQENIDNRDEAKSSYQQAAALLAKGLSIAEVTDTCHIPQAEAELISTLNHLSQKSHG